MIRHSVSFHRPTTMTYKRVRKYSHFPKSLKCFSKTIVIKYPVTTESAMKKIEDNNTLAFIVDKNATRKKIDIHINTIYNIQTHKINTAVRHDGRKIAFVKLLTDNDALNLSNKI